MEFRLIRNGEFKSVAMRNGIPHGRGNHRFLSAAERTEGKTHLIPDLKFTPDQCRCTGLAEVSAISLESVAAGGYGRDQSFNFDSPAAPPLGYVGGAYLR